MKGVTSSYTRAFGESCRREFEKVSFASSGIIPISHAYVRSILWSGDLQPSFHMYTLAHQATDWFVQGKGVDVLILGHAQDFNILDYGSPPELGSVLL